MVLFAPAALIAASALGLHQFFALWRVFASAVSSRSGSPAWKTVQPGAPQLAAHSRFARALTQALSVEAAQRCLRECTWRECKHHQNQPHTRAARCRGACDTDLWRAGALCNAQALDCNTSSFHASTLLSSRMSALASRERSAARRLALSCRGPVAHCKAVPCVHRTGSNAQQRPPMLRAALARQETSVSLALRHGFAVVFAA